MARTAFPPFLKLQMPLDTFANVLEAACMDDEG